MTTHTALILMASLLLVLTASVGYLLLRPSPSSTTPSPTPTSTPPTPSDPLLEMTKMMMMTMAKESAENRKLMETMMLGREQPPTEPQLSTFSNEPPMAYDPDSTPLAPGIEAILAREVEEDEQLRLMKERAALQARMQELILQQEKLEREPEDSLPGPWSVPEAELDLPM